MKGTPTKYKTMKGAAGYLKRLRAAYPEKKFEVLQHPTDFGWAIALMRDRCGRPIAWVDKSTGPLPGEAGYVSMETWNVEYTDTFGGEANYSWVQRRTFLAKANTSQQELMRRAKALVGLTRIKGVTNWHGDSGDFRPRNSATVLFVTWREPEEAVPTRAVPDDKELSGPLEDQQEAEHQKPDAEMLNRFKL